MLESRESHGVLESRMSHAARLTHEARATCYPASDSPVHATLLPLPASLSHPPSPPTLQVAPTPTWQTSAVASYLASGAKNPGTGNFNPAGRGYPDVAVVGHNYIISLGGA